MFVELLEVSCPFVPFGVFRVGKTQKVFPDSLCLKHFPVFPALPCPSQRPACNDSSVASSSASVALFMRIPVQHMAPPSLRSPNPRSRRYLITARLLTGLSPHPRTISGRFYTARSARLCRGRRPSSPAPGTARPCRIPTGTVPLPRRPSPGARVCNHSPDTAGVPRIHQFRIPTLRPPVLSRIPGSRLSSGIVTVNGNSHNRRHIPSSVPRIRGSWFVARKIFAPGRNSNSFS